MPIRDATPADIPAIARIHVDSWRATYRGLMPDDLLAGLSYERRERLWTQVIGRLDDAVGCTVVADESAEGIVGFAGWRNRRGDWDYDGELLAIYLPETHQGRGLARPSSWQSSSVWRRRGNARCCSGARYQRDWARLLRGAGWCARRREDRGAAARPSAKSPTAGPI
ncbi:MAG: hypothetical protein U0841_27230 [Chloroflexia bacterium]